MKARNSCFNMKRAKRIALLRIDVRMKVELPVKYMQDTWALNFAFLPTQDYKIQSFFGLPKKLSQHLDLLLDRFL